MCSKALKRLTCAFSLLLAAAMTLASEVTDFRDAVAQARSRGALQALLQSAPEAVSSDGSLSFYFDYSLDVIENEYEASWTEVRQWIVDELDAKIALEGRQIGGGVTDPQSESKKILANPLYSDRQERKDRNWLDRAGDRIGDRIIAWLSQFEFRRPSGNMGFLEGLMGGLNVFMWIVILVIIGLVLYFVLRNVSGAAKRKRRVGGILEDDEPERTADQWLLQAERLESEGRYREAVRCLYLACLVRYDDGNVARFRRHETNWEHLYRIEASAANPREIDFRSTTQVFDKVWYGNQVNGVEDVRSFREVYQRLCSALQIKTAA